MCNSLWLKVIERGKREGIGQVLKSNVITRHGPVSTTFVLQHMEGLHTGDTSFSLMNIKSNCWVAVYSKHPNTRCPITRIIWNPYFFYFGIQKVKKLQNVRKGTNLVWYSGAIWNLHHLMVGHIFTIQKPDWSCIWIEVLTIQNETGF